jgi:hypothetical protein
MGRRDSGVRTLTGFREDFEAEFEIFLLKNLQKLKICINFALANRERQPDIKRMRK